MNSSNSFIAYAYLKVNEKPYSVLCNYICYAIQKTGYEVVSAEQIISKVQEEFGVEVSNLLLQTCLRILEKDARLYISRSTHGIKLLKLGFDIERFERERTTLKQQECALIQHIIEYSQNLGVVPTWTEKETREHLNRFFITDNFSLNLALTGEMSTSKANRLSPEWYIGRYVQTLNKSDEDYKYLLCVSHGMMVYIGITATTNDKQEFTQKFEGTDFYLDTRLTLRAMGYSLPFYTQSAQELLTLITKYNKGNLKIFHHTFLEIDSALGTAERELKFSKRIKDEELNLFAIYNSCDAEDFHVFRASAKEKLEKHLKIELIQTEINWNDSEVQKNNLDWDGLSKKIVSDHKSWHPNAIKNDIESINSINILRKGNYTERFGGKKKLPILVTTNTALIASIREFVIEQFDAKEVAQQGGWTKSRLPIVSDSVLLCRLWVPQSSKLSELPDIFLAANAFVAQQSETGFYEKLKDAYKQANLIHKETILNIDDFRHRKLEEEIVTQSHGDLEEVDASLVALSLDEILRAETDNDKQEIIRLKGEFDITNQQKLEQIGAWFTAYCQQYLRKQFARGLRLITKINKKIWSYLIPIAITIFGEVIILGLSLLDEEKWWLIFLPALIAGIFSLIDNMASNMNIAKRIQQHYHEKLKSKFIKRIEEELPPEIVNQKSEIVSYCINSIECFKD